ncbi:putative Heat shock transcription factor family [Medicago truncatula]|uniref:Putative Heat shock transcription factor family n=1 Tax=Medicago truncatula TaxID=3880 RepID=A0A396J9K8_MEDTR|nr:putative Heat shock transcription factor family [Medicago truncatula]
MNNIHRKKTLDSHSLQNTHGQGAATPLSEIERQNLNDIIENLKHDNEHILLEIQTREEEKKIHETQLNYSKEHLKVLEQKQQSMLYSVGHALHKPEIECLIWSPVENTQRKRRYPRNSPFGNEARTQNLVENSQVLRKECICSLIKHGTTVHARHINGSFGEYWNCNSSPCCS